MPQAISLNSQNKYEIRIYGQADDSWLRWFRKANVHSETLKDATQVTMFSNVLMDQPGLVGLIRRLHGLGIVLVSVIIVLMAGTKELSRAHKRNVLDLEDGQAHLQSSKEAIA